MVAIVKPVARRIPDLPQPLLDPEPEEQHHQQQGGDDDEEAEVGEVLAEVGRAGRGGERRARGPA